MKTLQDVFNTVATHLLKQGRRSENNTGACLYRDGPRRCAVGVLIADEHYHETLEYQGVATAAVMTSLERSGWPCTPEAENLYYTLQYVHDSVRPRNWREKLASVAKTFNLDASCLNTESHG